MESGCGYAGDVADDDDVVDENKVSEKEKAFLRRLDGLLITFVWFSYCIKQIDASNYKTAYVSGMKEELSLNGNELNYFDSLFRLGYAISIIPSCLLLTTYVRPSVLLPSLELIWGIMTGLIAIAKSPTIIYVARFVIGICEASAYPGTICILMNWYTPTELSTRVSIFCTSYPAACIFVGSMQAALWKGMNGKGGLSGWRWLFLLNGIMTIMIALLGYIMIPDSPLDTRAWWISPSHGVLARRRMARVGKTVGSSGKVRNLKDWGVLAQRMVKDRTLYMFAGGYAAWAWSQNANIWYPLYLKSLHRFTIVEINVIPIGAYVLHGASMVAFAKISDKSQKRVPWIIIQLLPHLAACVALSIYPSSFVGQMVAWHMLFVSNGVGPIFLAWMAETPGWIEVPERRNLAVSVMVAIVYAVDSGLNVILWPAAAAPLWTMGFAISAGCALSCIAGAITLYYWLKENYLPRRAGEND